MSSRLREEWGAAVSPVRWDRWRRETTRDDWFLTGELFSEEERPGFTDWLRSRPCRFGAIFHDALPLRLPRITWPRSVARHPGYMKLLSEFDRIWAVSEASRRDLLEFWKWQGLRPRAEVGVLALGADSGGGPRAAARTSPPAPDILCVGILEPRKNQLRLMEAVEALWTEGLACRLHLVGRVNPHFGAPIVARIKAARRRWPGRLVWHDRGDDALLQRLYREVRVTAFATLGEGCGLPVLESLWQGVPCVCSDLPVLLENAAEGGCVTVPPDDTAAWQRALGGVLTDDAAWSALTRAAVTRPLPTWARSVEALKAAL